MFKHTSREANKEATPIGMKIMLTSRNAEITCTHIHTQIYINYFFHAN